MARTIQGISLRHLLWGGPAAIALTAAAALSSVPTIAPPGPRLSSIVGADPAVVGRGATLYVSAAGSDLEPCADRSRPCRQIRRAIELAHPGDTILVAPGIYDAFDVAKDGLVIRAQDPERRPVISWKKELGQGELVRVRASNVVIDGLAGYRAFYCGLRVSGDRLAHPQQITVRNCVFGDDGELGIMTNDGVRRLLIERNVTYGSLIQHGIYVANDARDVIVRANLSFGNADAGLQLNGEDGPGITNAWVYNNILYENGEWTKEGARHNAASVRPHDILWRKADGSLARIAGVRFHNGPAIALYHVREARVFNNLAFDNYRGLAAMECGGRGGGADIRIYHNTVVMRERPAGSLPGRNDALKLFHWNPGSHVTMRNNVFCSPGYPPTAVCYAPDTSSDYNLFVGAIPPGEGAHSSVVATAAKLFVDPASADPTRRDYRLLPGVTTRGIRIPDVVSDLAGNVRGEHPTPGVFEEGGVRKISLPGTDLR